MSEPLPIDLGSLLGPDADRVAAGSMLRAIAHADPRGAGELFAQLHAAAHRLGSSDPAILGGLLHALHTQVLRGGESAAGTIDPPAVPAILAALPDETPNRHLLLQLLALARTPEHLKALAEQMVAQPPGEWVQVGQALGPLFQSDAWPVEAVFPRLLDALQHASTAAAVLDLANHLARRGRVALHPAAAQGDRLASLLGAVVGRLGQLEEDPRQFGDSVAEVQAVLGEAVALAVSLCDALGLIGEPGAIGRLNQALELSHRRVQTEAAGALAKLRDEKGTETLLALAAEPAARLRVLAYAEELGLSDSLDAQYRTDTAQAEAEMALWLSQPQQMAVPPSSVEVIDSRRQFWPGFEQRIDCHLVRFHYDFGDRSYSGVGLTGPIVHAFAADLADLPPEDIYAAFAGWQAEHPDIYEVPRDQWNEAQLRLAQPLLEHLDREGFEEPRPALLGFFLGEHGVAGSARREEAECVVATDGVETIDFTTQGRLRPLTPVDAWNIFKGRKMLRTFNG